MLEYDEKLANRIRRALTKDWNFTEKEVYGSWGFWVGDQLVCGVLEDDLLCRVDPGEQGKLLAERNVKPFDDLGRKMTGFVILKPGALKAGKALEWWLDKAVIAAKAHAKKLRQ